jgi:hypothetical protein
VAAADSGAQPRRPAGRCRPGTCTTGKTDDRTRPNQSAFASETDNTAVYFLTDPRSGNEPFYVGQSNQPSNRYVQHLEDVNTADVFAHPKKLQTAQLLQAGVVPQMSTIGWYAGTPDATDDEADKQEQMWIGYFFYRLGKTANVTAPRYEAWQAILVETGVTVEDLDAAFAEIKAGTYSQMEAVKLARDPRITESVFPDPSVPEGALGNKARLWHPRPGNLGLGRGSGQPGHRAPRARRRLGRRAVGPARRRRQEAAAVVGRRLHGLGGHRHAHRRRTQGAARHRRQ